MKHRSSSSAVGFAVLLTIATAAEIQVVQAQNSAFQLPASVPQGTTVRVNGSSSMAAVNSALKQRFEQQYPGTQVITNPTGTSAALKALLEDKVDLAAIARPLTDAERAQGLNAIQVGRDKIAIVVGQTNPFSKSINANQFARMFRGEITNWSQVGGASQPVKFVDRPTSDTRQAFTKYPVFEKAKFATGTTAQKLTEDTPQAVIKNLGRNGIGYVASSQVQNQKGVKVLPMDGILPSDARYPFSQPLYYVYKGEPSAAVKAFLGFATAPVGQKTIGQTGVTAIVAADPKLGSQKPATKPAKPADQTTDKKPTAKAGTDAGKPATNPPAGDKAVSLTAPSANQPGQSGQSGTAPGNNADGGLFGFLPSLGGETGAAGETGTGFPNWLWWLLPIGSGAVLLWMLGRGRRSTPIEPDPVEVTPVYMTGGEPYETDLNGADLNGTDLNGNGFGTNIEGGFDPWQGNANVENPAPTIDSEVGGGNPFGDAANLTGAAFVGGAALVGGAAAWSALGRNSRVVLKSRGSAEVEAFWDIPNADRQAARQQGGEKLALRLYDVTDIDLDRQPPHSIQQFECDELTQRQRLPIGLSDRDYLAEIGYLTREGQWLGMARSTHVRVQSSTNAGSNSTPIDQVTTDEPIDPVDPEKPILAGDRDLGTPAIDAPTWNEPQPPTSQSSNWLQQITQKASDVAGGVTQAGGAAAAGGAALAGGMGAAAWSFLSGRRNPNETATQTESAPTPVPATPHHDFMTGEAWTEVGEPTLDATTEFGLNPAVEHNAQIDAVTPVQGRMVLTPRNGQWAYAYWDVPRMQRAEIDRQADQNLVLRLYDVTDADLEFGLPVRFEQFDVDDLALSCDVPISQSDRSYISEIGYVDQSNQWIPLARSTSVWIPSH